MSGYAAQDFEDPLYSLLVKLSVQTVSHEDYNVLASVDADTLTAYTEAALANDNGGSWEGFLLALRELEQEGASDSSPPPPPPPEDLEDDAAGQHEHEMDDYDVRQTAAEGTELEPEQQLPWKCTRCGYPRNPYEQEACIICRASYWHEDEPLTASSILSETPSAIEMLIRSEDLPVPGCALTMFNVKKGGSKDGSLFSQKQKDRVVKIDFCSQRFLNCDPSNPSRHSVSLESKDLYRVEKRYVQCPAAAAGALSANHRPPSAAEHVLRVYFFKTSHPIDLQFPNGVECRRFVEQASLHRRHPVVWAPSLCRGCKRETVLRVFDEKAIRRNGASAASPRDLPSLTASRVSHEIVRFWIGCVELVDGDIGPSAELRTVLTAHGADVLFVGLVGLASGKSGGGKKLQELLEGMCGAEYYTILNSLAGLNPFANVEMKGPDELAAVVLVRRSHLSKLSHLALESLEDPSHGKNRGIFAALDMQESKIGVLLATTDVDEDTMDTEEKHGRLRALFGAARCGDPNIDVSNKFDYLFVAGRLGYSTACVRGEWSDELREALPTRTFLAGFKEEEGILGSGSATRVLSWCRETGTSAKPVAYGPWTALLALDQQKQQQQTVRELLQNSAAAVVDLFCLRTYLYAWSVPVPCPTITVRHVRIVLEGLSSGAKRTHGGAVASSPSISAASVVLSSRCMDRCPMLLPSKQYDGKELHGKSSSSSSAVVHAEVPPLVPLCPALEWLHMQHLVFSLRGLVPFVTFQEAEVIGSAAVPLRVACGGSVGQLVEVTAPLYRRTTPIGSLECSIMITY